MMIIDVHGMARLVEGAPKLIWSSQSAHVHVHAMMFWLPPEQLSQRGMPVCAAAESCLPAN